MLFWEQHKKESGGISVLENGTLNSFCPYHIFGYFYPSKKRKRGKFLEFFLCGY
jgi:hypothetical protein